MMNRIKVRKAEIKDIITATFPAYKGRKFYVEFTERVTFWDTNWGGGTKNSYVALASDGRTARLKVKAPWINVVEGQTVDVPQDALIVKHSYFCGQEMGITIYAHPTHSPKWLTS